MTSIDWLIEKLMDSGYGIPKEWREKSKEMHKEEMKGSYEDGWFSCEKHYQEELSKDKLNPNYDIADDALNM